jgi:LmbE family N-acetylglucosaminyl deacetylase
VTAVVPIVPERVLAVVAHPDDIDYGSAGTIAGWTSRGVEVAYCIATYGDAGGFDDTPRDRMSGLREAEQRAAAATIGVTDVTFLGYPDGQLTVSYELRRDITRQIRRVRPQLILTSTPVRNFQRAAASHPDHLAIGEATLCAVYPDARNPFAHPELLAAEGLEAWAVPEVWMTGSTEADHWVDITDMFELKLAALRAHESQTRHLGDGLEKLLRDWNGSNAAAAGLPSGRLAEAYQVASTI